VPSEKLRRRPELSQTRRGGWGLETNSSLVDLDECRWGPRCRRRSIKRTALGAEPTGNVVKVMIKMPNGTKVQRSFLATDK
jgi:hypothetical protein